MKATYGSRLVAVVAGLAIAAAVPALASRAGGAPPAGAVQQAVGVAAQAAAVRYWTAARMSRDLVRLPPRGAPQDWLTGDTAGAGLRWTHGGTVAAAVGRVFFTLGGTDYVCSGALVDSADPDRADPDRADPDRAGPDGADPDVVLTAAHCVTGAPGRGRATQWAANWVFVPGYADGRLPYGEYTGRRFLVSRGWTAPGGGEPDDIAFVQVTAAGQPNRLPHGLPVAFAASQGGAVLTRSYVFGYPAEPPYTGLYLAYCAGRVTVPGGGARLPCGMTAGDSGGPWLAGFRPRSGSGVVTAVTTYKLSGDLAVLYGAVLGPQARALYQRAVRSAR
jgi:hypothetical protein